jgi:hypothetical protein
VNLHSLIKKSKQKTEKEIIMAEDPNKKYNESYAQTRGLKQVPGTNQPVGWAKDRKSLETKQTANKGCFVATAAYGDYNAPEVVYLSAFRDESLSKSYLGRAFINAYYAISPPLAAIIAKSSSRRGIVRKFFLQPIIYLLRATFKPKI